VRLIVCRPAPGRQGDVPPAQHDRVFLAHEESDAGVRSGRRIVAAACSVVHPSEDRRLPQLLISKKTL
jgi:hypothetical protein